MEPLTLIKVGGAELKEGEDLERLADALAGMAAQGPLLVVHGGGPEIAELQQRLGLAPRFVEGLRVTDKESLRVAEMVLSGSVNKRLTARLVIRGVKALGLSGVDAGLLQADCLKHPAGDLGRVGEITAVRGECLLELIGLGYTPVISPISLGCDGRPYNVNADHAALAIARALGVAEMVLLTDVPGVMHDGQVLAGLTADAVHAMISGGVITGGMIPKVRSALTAIECGVGAAHITNLAGLAAGSGTRVVARASHSPFPPKPKGGNSMNGDEIKALDERYVLRTYARAPFVIERGEGVRVYDTEGKAYLDFVSGIAVNALGYGDPDVLAAIAEQSRRLMHVSNLYHTVPQAQLAQVLVERSFADKVFFCNSGTEAVEAALKFARKWAKKNGGENKIGFVAFEGAFHGRTMGALSLTPRASYQDPFRPLIPGASFGTFNDLASAEALINDDTCACLVEPVQGEGGVHLADPAFLTGLRALCDRHGALLIFDEVQSGLGRTGTLWAHEPYGVTPDLMTLAKPLGGGLPIGATLMTAAVASAIEPGDHGSTFAANPVVCAAAQVVVSKIGTPSFLERVRSLGTYLEESLLELEHRHPCITQVRGRGLIWGIEAKVDVGPAIDAGFAKGLLTCKAGAHVLRLLPPLVVSEADIDHATAILDHAFSAL